MSSLNSAKISDGRTRAAGGFTLIELAIVVGIVGFLLGAILIPLSTQVQATKYKETERSLEEVRRALIGYALTQGPANRVFPCPDDPATGGIDGTEDVTGTTCDVNEGILPWRVLGVKRDDAWGRLFRYRVTAEFANTVTVGTACGTASAVDLCDTGDISVSSRGDDPASGTGGELKELVGLTATAPVVVISHGANGSGGTSVNGTTVANPTGADELENIDSDANFISRPISGGSTGCADATEGVPYCEFDDVVMWISTPALLGRLVEARLLP